VKRKATSWSAQQRQHGGAAKFAYSVLGRLEIDGCLDLSQLWRVRHRQQVPPAKTVMFISTANPVNLTVD
jgi:hypothetical protein